MIVSWLGWTSILLCIKFSLSFNPLPQLLSCYFCMLISVVVQLMRRMTIATRLACTSLLYNRRQFGCYRFFLPSFTFLPYLFAFSWSERMSRPPSTQSFTRETYQKVMPRPHAIVNAMLFALYIAGWNFCIAEECRQFVSASGINDFSYPKW